MEDVKNGLDAVNENWQVRSRLARQNRQRYVEYRYFARGRSALFSVMRVAVKDNRNFVLVKRRLESA